MRRVDVIMIWTRGGVGKSEKYVEFVQYLRHYRHNNDSEIWKTRKTMIRLKLNLANFQSPKTVATMEIALTLAKQRNSGFVYITDDGTDDDPWDNLATFFSQEVTAICQVNGGCSKIGGGSGRTGGSGGINTTPAPTTNMTTSNTKNTHSKWSSKA